jgi:hypothetical protein
MANIEKLKQTTALANQAPDFIKRGAQAEGTSRLDEVVVPPLIKIMQKQSDDALLTTFPKGTVILRPVDILVANVGQSFKFVPLMQFTEYVTWAPIEMKGQVPAILDRTFDQRSELARKATDANRWSENGYKFKDKIIDKVRHVEHIVFIIQLVDHPAGDIAAALSFARAEHKTGRSFASLLKMRNADAFGCVFEAVVPSEPRKNDKGSWYGLNISNPKEGSPWVTDKALFEHLRATALKLEEAFANKRLRTDLDPDEAVEQRDEGAERRDDM